MIIGFTGTQDGMSHRQIAALTDVLHLFRGSIFHHGNCIGADDKAHEIAVMCGLIVHIHPCNIEAKQAKCIGARRYDAKPPLERNKDIVFHSHLLIAAPKNLTEVVRSGTWSTVRYARRTNVPVLILDP